MSGNSLPISSRASRLNSLIINRPESLSKDQKEVCSAINREGLLDALFLLYDECSKDALKKRNKNINDFATKYRPIIRETKQLRVSLNDFDVKSLIGNGYFGDVHLVTERSTKDVYAMKIIKKTMVSNCQVREERDIMVLGRKCEWITRLQYAFQDRDNLFLVMEYLPGGDLLGLMIHHGSFDEEFARFYLAELALAIDALHKLGFVHRDIKPENCLLDRFGHLKLADFGSSMALSEDGSFISISPVGTPDYVAPELLQILSTSKPNQTMQKLDASCDYWSMGIIGFEMITEKTPFHSDNVYDTYSEIQKYSNEERLMQVLEFPMDIRMSRKLKDLLNGLITKPNRRMTFEEIKDHPFFGDINWYSLREQPPPIIPSLNSEDDTSNFDEVDKSKRRSPVLKKSTFPISNINEFSGDDLPFLGYTYVYEESSKFLKATPKHSTSMQLESKLSNKIGDLQLTIKEQMKEIKFLQKDLLSAEKKATQMCSLERLYGETKEDMESLKSELKQKIAELASCKTEIKTLKSSLKIEEEMRLKSDASTAEVMGHTYQKWEKAKKASDLSFEKQINEKKSEIRSLNDRIRAGEVELSSKIVECNHLNATLEKYKEMLKNSKEQNILDKTDYEEVQRKITDSFEGKVHDLKTKFNAEKELRIKSEQTIKDLRKQLDEATKINKNILDLKEKADTEISAIRSQLGHEVDEGNRLKKDKKELEMQVKEINQKNDELRKEMLKLQDESLKRHLKLTKIVTQPIHISGRASSEENFRSAHGSLTDLDVVDPEELKNDLARAKENEDIQRKRADNLEHVVQKLEEMLKKLNETTSNTAGGMLEKRNEKLEDQLASAREQAIIDRQAARTANLSLWKLEKEVENLKHERDILNRRLENANEKSSDAVHKKESVELQMKQQLDTISMKETQIIDLQKDIRNLKFELKQDRDKYSNTERERLREKTEIIEKSSKIKNLEEKLRECENKARLLDIKVSKLSDEKEIVQRRFNEEKSAHSSAQEIVNELQAELTQKTKNYEALKEAVVATELQLNTLEDMWNAEVQHNQKNVEKIDDLWSKVKARDEEISKLKKELSQEKSLKLSAESKGCQLQNESDELKEEMQKMQDRMYELQNQLVKKQEFLYEAQENVEITSSELNHLQKLKNNYESEIVILKEETSRILTDLYRSKEEAKRLSMELKDSQIDICELKQEKEHLNSLMLELKQHSKERDIRLEATDAQQKKLIAYLHQRVDELQNKKKRTIADVLFGSNTANTNLPPATPKTARKENIPPQTPSSESVKLKKAEDDLKRERERNQKLKENLLLTKLEIRKSASIKSPEKAKTRESTVDTVEPSAPVEDSVRTITATVHAEPNRKLLHENFQRDSLTSASSPKAHHFAMTIETASPSPNMPPTTCLACDKFILVGQPYWQCKECKLSVHRKCRGMVKSNCLQSEKWRLASSSETTSTATSETLSKGNRSFNKKTILDDVDGIKPFESTEDSCSIGSGTDLMSNYNGDHILNSSRFGLGWVMTSTPKINAVYELTTSNILFGCSTGLFSWHTDDSRLVQIKGLTSVNYISIKPNLTKSILIADNGDNLFECDFRVLMNKSQQSGLLEPKLNLQAIDLSIANRCPDEKWHMVELYGNSEHLNDAVAIAATSARMVILKYDAKMGRFKPVRSLDTVTAISSILFTQHSAIVSCDKFFEIDLSTYVAEEFLDMSDLSLRPSKNWKPMNVFRINSREFLLCFDDCGVFVDEYGLRARQENLEWIHEPREFYYKNFLLYIIHDESIQILKINNSTRKHEKDLLTDNNQSRTFVMMDGDKKFTHNGCTGLYSANIIRNVHDGGNNTQDLIKIDAEKAFKINLNRSLSSIISDSNTSLATLSTASSRSSGGADTIN